MPNLISLFYQICFTGQIQEQENKLYTIKPSNKKPPHAVHINVMEKDALEYTRAIKTVLRSPFLLKYYSIQVRLVPK